MRDMVRHIFTSRLMAALLLCLSCQAAKAEAVTVVLEPSADATLYSNYATPTANSIGQHLFVGYTFRESIRRSLLRFDVASALPCDAQILDATLTLNCSLRSIDTVPLVTSIHAVVTQWAEGTARAQSPEGGGATAQEGDPTWDFARFSNVPWTAPGGDFSAEVIASATVTDLGPVTWSDNALANLVQDWVHDPNSNLGMIIRGSESDEGSAKRFDSRENLIPGNRPQLTITYTVPEAPDETHAADTSGDGALSLSEVLRVIQFYNAADHHCGDSEDGYLPGLGDDRECARHDLDFQQPAWRITLSEVLRAVQFYSAGAFYPCDASEDGWCAGEPSCP